MNRAGIGVLARLVGISSYWAWNVIDRSQILGFGGFSSNLDPFVITGITVISSLAILPLATILKRPLAWAAIRLVLAVVAIGAVAALALAYFDRGNNLALHASTVLLAILRAGTFIFWFIWLVSLDKQEFIQTLVTGASLLALLFLFAVSLPTQMGTVLFFACILLSGMAFLSVGSLGTSSRGERDIAPRFTARALAGFAAVRFLLGFLIGLAASINPLGETAGINWPVRLAAAALALAALAFALAVRRSRPPALLLCSPVMLSLLIALPAVFGSGFLPQSAIALVWFGSMLVSAIHLFRNIGLLDMDLPSYVGLSQILSALGTFVGNNLQGLEARFAPLQLAAYGQIASILAIFAVLAAAAQFLLAKTMLAEKSPANAPGDTLAAVQRLTARHGLTPREHDVLELLAEGYSRPYISERLILSLSTIKTHVNHLYAKMGVNKRDELLSAIDAEKTRCD
jgi:DNA-binding CsgD family transcriptional regulator